MSCLKTAEVVAEAILGPLLKHKLLILGVLEDLCTSLGIK